MKCEEQSVHATFAYLQGMPVNIAVFFESVVEE